MFQNYDDHSTQVEAKPRLSRLRKLMKEKQLDGYLLQRTDEYMNEYVPEYAERLAWITGFTGSTGQSVILHKKAGVFVDGRYTLQARQQLDDDLFETVQIGDVKLSDWLCDNLKADMTLGFDPKLFTATYIISLRKALEKKDIRLLAVNENLIDQLWDDQPDAPKGAVSLQPLKYAGVNPAKKIEEIQNSLKTEKQDAAIITKSDSIAWLLNIRGSDVPHTPLPLSFLILYSDKKPTLYIDPDKLSSMIEKHILKYADISNIKTLQKDLKSFTKDNIVRLDTNTASYWFYDILNKKKVSLAEQQDPCILPKAIKNTAEIEGTRSAHQRDAVAVCRFLCWLDEYCLEAPLDEITVAQKLESFRQETNELKDISFDTISGSGPNGAIIHYRVTETTNKKLKKNSLYLVDSGAQYQDGTTDITRTVAIGNPTNEMKVRFTQVLKGMIAVTLARFPKGTNGSALDSLARIALWKSGVDYAHGTGHGVGSYLSVHEGPQSISKQSRVSLEPGMILSNEPGYYKEGKYGIRIENLILVTPASKIPGGEIDMMGFETLTYVPIDTRLIDAELLDDNELRWLNSYHAKVKKTVSPHLDKYEKAWLAKVTNQLNKAV